MQNIVHKLQSMIQTYYGFESHIDWKNITDGTLPENTEDQTLSVPLYEPQSKNTVAYFKVMNVPPQQKEVQEKLRELIQFSLQN